MGPQVATRRDGSSPDTAIIVEKVCEEYEWIGRNCPDFVFVKEAFIEVDGRPFDRLILRSEDGVEKEVYFDISPFFGKGKKPGPPCPYCGALLRTARAKQCGKCGMDWHDPANVVRWRGEWASTDASEFPQGNP